MEKYFSVYSNTYETGDMGYRDIDDYFHVMTRLDDVINVAGHRLCTSAIEEVLMLHPSVAEAAVVGVRDEVKGEVPLGFITLKDNAPVGDIELELIKLVRAHIGPIASFKRCLVIPKMPKTRSGKYLRNILRAMCNH